MSATRILSRSLKPFGRFRMATTPLRPANTNSIALMVFLIAYAIFEVPSNYLLKKLSPSKWISFLMFSWGAITMGLGGVRSFGAVTAVRFLLGVFEAGKVSTPANLDSYLFHYRTLPRPCILPHILVPNRRALDPRSHHPCIRNTGRCIWRRPRIRDRAHEPDTWSFRLAMAFHNRRYSILCFGSFSIFLPSRLPRDVKMVVGGREGTGCRTSPHRRFAWRGKQLDLGSGERDFDGLEVVCTLCYLFWHFGAVFFVRHPRVRVCLPTIIDV